ncbi:MAG TPA: alpha/beta hydrolase [Bacteriovoracaceae bacterium]|nr:alpha/beta hydrolase [Bacteriovoracaceae bacterium]
MIKQKHFYLIRGLAREALHWDDFPEHLLQFFPDSRITMIDIPGAGEYVNHPTPLSIDKMTEVMHRKYLASTKPGEQSIMIAISLGGMIAATWMKNHPEDFQQLVLINTSFGGCSPVYHRIFPQALMYLCGMPLKGGRAREEYVLKLVSNNPLRFDRTLDLWEKISQQREVSRLNTIRQLLAAAFFKVSEAKPHVPVLLLGSTNDRMVNIKCSRAIASKWNVPLIEHPQGGHDLTTDYPDWVVLQIKNAITS